MKLFRCNQNRQNERGQIVVLLALSISVVVLCMALAVDVGFAYVAKAKLSKAVDAACLTAMRNLAQGQTTARTLATNSFNANYETSAIDASPPSITINFSSDGNGQTLVSATATATIQTFFLPVLSQYKTWQVSDSAQATRGKLVMTLVLDRSNSMNNNGGATALPPAVTSFVKDFDDSVDEVAMASYASSSTLNVAINYNFITPITNAVKALKFNGGTYGPGGLVYAKSQNESVPVQPGQNVVKVAVYFTDGYVNVIQQTLSCGAIHGSKGTPTLLNFGGYDSGSTVDFFDPSNGNDNCSYDGGSYPSCCTGVTGFTSAINGSFKSFTRSNVTNDSVYDALQLAEAMRSEGMFVYAVGLGSKVDQSFLRQIANDPASASYNPNEPAGMAVFAPSCPSSQCTAQLEQVFQTIASKILLRLTQ